MKVTTRLSRLACLAGLLAGYACGDPQLRVLLSMPAAYRGDVDRVSMQILRPTQANPFGCEELAFQDIDPEIVDFSLVAEKLLEPGDSGYLADIDRVAPKVIRLRALDAHGLPVLMACAEVGEVVGEHVIEVAAEPAALVSLGDLDEVLELTRLDAELPESIEVGVSDIHNAPLAGTAVRWRFLGPGAAAHAGEGVTGDSGQLRFNRSAADQFPPGPYFIEVQVRWARRIPPVLKGYNAPAPEYHLAHGRLVDAQVGRIGPQGQPGYAILMDECPGGRNCVAYRIVGGEQGQIDLPQDLSILNMGILGAGDGDRVVFLATESLAGPEIRWYGLDIPGREIVRGESMELPLDPWPDPHRFKLHPVGSCLARNEKSEILVVSSLGAVSVYTRDAGGRIVPRADSPFSQLAEVDRIVASGCVSRQSGDIVPTVLLRSREGGAVVAYDAGGIERFDWIAFPQATGFVSGRAPEPALMLTAHLGVESPSVARRMHVRAADGAWARLEAVSWDPLLAIPRLLAGGDVDGDGRGDVVAVIYPGAYENAPPGADTLVAMQTVLGVQQRNRRLSGSTRVVRQYKECSPVPRVLELIDLDGNGVDDILLFFDGTEPEQPLGPLVVVETQLMGR